MCSFSFHWSGHWPILGMPDPSLQGLGDIALSPVQNLVLNRPLCYSDASQIPHHPHPNPTQRSSKPWSLNPDLINSMDA